MIIHGDALQELKKLDDDSIDLIFIDPPYSTKTSQQGVFSKQKNWFSSDCMSERVFTHFLVPACKELWRTLKPFSHMYCMTNEHQIRNMMDILEYSGFAFQKIIVWDKQNYAIGSNKSWSPQCEYVLFFSKLAPKALNNGKRGNIISLKRKRQKYPTMKPEELVEIFVTEASQPGEVVLDCFAGSGTTGVAAQKHGREYILIDSSEKAIRICEERLLVEGTGNTISGRNRKC